MILSYCDFLKEILEYKHNMNILELDRTEDLGSIQYSYQFRTKIHTYIVIFIKYKNNNIPFNVMYCSYSDYKLYTYERLHLDKDKRKFKSINDLFSNLTGLNDISNVLSGVFSVINMFVTKYKEYSIIFSGSINNKETINRRNKLYNDFYNKNQSIIFPKYNTTLSKYNEDEYIIKFKAI